MTLFHVSWIIYRFSCSLHIPTKQGCIIFYMMFAHMCSMICIWHPFQGSHLSQFNSTLSSIIFHQTYEWMDKKVLKDFCSGLPSTSSMTSEHFSVASFFLSLSQILYVSYGIFVIPKSLSQLGLLGWKKCVPSQKKKHTNSLPQRPRLLEGLHHHPSHPRKYLGLPR